MNPTSRTEDPEYRPWPRYKPYKLYCTGDPRFQDPRLLQGLSWNLGYRSSVRYNLYRFVPDRAPVSKIRRKDSAILDLGIVDPPGTTCTGCTGLYPDQVPYPRSNTKYVADLKRTKIGVFAFITWRLYPVGHLTLPPSHLEAILEAPKSNGRR